MRSNACNATRVGCPVLRCEKNSTNKSKIDQTTLKVKVGRNVALDGT